MAYDKAIEKHFGPRRTLELAQAAANRNIHYGSLTALNSALAYLPQHQISYAIAHKLVDEAIDNYIDSKRMGWSGRN